MKSCRCPTFLVGFFALVFYSHLCRIASAEIRYEVTNLGNLGGAFVEVSGINSSGQVVGGSYNSDYTAFHAFLWTPTVPNGTTRRNVRHGNARRIRPGFRYQR